jgi:uncharacterized protein (DUF305 family)
MKYIIILVIVLGVILGGITLSQPTETVYQAPEVVVQKEEVQVDALEQAIKHAQDASRSNMEQIAQKAYDDAYDQEMKKIELEVIAEFNKKLDARQIELEKETKLY